MNELFFIGTDILEETKRLSEFTTIMCTDGMTDSELSAYKLGVQNTLSALMAVLDVDEDNECVVNINGMEIPTELDIDDLEKYLLDD
jgi:hypothetical protein